ncbi:uncharacterized protein [Blastocystis hominis]|uniref:Polo kinase n=1 Tax=Blastocystis hominis TaxID=12968 RepID=D8M5N7_BLAHO|nr:uncharacterized protein [Blastocystis hominis]CBK23376.2 unnamed protein product [Blastocystis hominis]|eukprot:XP_012897424.1 uncharacterized protein [Blastocystis hominis]
MYKHFEDNRYHYLILELCSHDTLGHLIKNRKYLTEPEVQYFLLQIIDAVKYLHNRRIIHRDLKLGNVFLDDNLDVKVGDFGLATELSEPNERKKTMCGTPNYIAPEILESEGKRAYSYEVDIWAIGVITYTLLIGKAPYDGGSRKSTYENIRQNDFSFPIKDRFVSHQARMFIRSILTTDPASRLSLDQMLQHPFFTDSPISPPKSLPPYILYQPYLLTSRPATEPTPVLQRVHRSTSSSDSAADPSSSPQPVACLTSSRPRQQTRPHDGPREAAAARGREAALACGDAARAGRAGRELQLRLRREREEQHQPVLADGAPGARNGRPAGSGQPDLPRSARAHRQGDLRGAARGHGADVPGTPMLIGHAANLHTAMHHPLLMKNADAISTTRTANWIVDEYDFTRKYGIAYMFSNGLIGVLFNDKTSIVVSSNGLYYEYHPRISIKEWNRSQQFPPLYKGSIDDFPAEISKKITLVKYFRTTFHERANNREISKEELEDIAKGGPAKNLPFVIKWLIKEEASIIMLSTGAIQVRYEGGTILNLECPFDDVTYLDKFGMITAVPLAKAVGLGRDDLKRRLDYVTNNITDIVTTLSRNH